MRECDLTEVVSCVLDRKRGIGWSLWPDGFSAGFVEAVRLVEAEAARREQEEWERERRSRG